MDMCKTELLTPSKARKNRPQKPTSNIWDLQIGGRGKIRTVNGFFGKMIHVAWHKDNFTLYKLKKNNFFFEHSARITLNATNVSIFHD